MKQGAKTTEFWISVAPIIGGLVESIKGDAQNYRYLIVCGTILSSLYIISRTVVKFKTKTQ